VTDTNPSSVSAPRSAATISSATTSDPTPASGWNPPTDPGGNDEVVGGALQGGGGKHGAGGRTGEPGPHTNDDDVDTATAAAVGSRSAGAERVGTACSAECLTVRPRRQRPKGSSHRVPLHRNRGGDKHPAQPSGSDYASFSSLKFHSPDASFSPCLMDTSVESPCAPYCALKNTLPGMVRYVFVLESVSG
jgi:hypothetical protein